MVPSQASCDYSLLYRIHPPQSNGSEAGPQPAHGEGIPLLNGVFWRKMHLVPGWSRTRTHARALKDRRSPAGRIQQGVLNCERIGPCEILLSKPSFDV